MLESTKQRPAFGSVVFMLNECCDALTALKEINRLHSEISKMKYEEREPVSLS